jgi:hypothetical protein
VQSAPLICRNSYMREQCAKLSRGHDPPKAVNYIFKRSGLLSHVYVSNIAAEERYAALHWVESRGYCVGWTAESVALPPSQRR